MFNGKLHDWRKRDGNFNVVVARKHEGDRLGVVGYFTRKNISEGDYAKIEEGETGKEFIFKVDEIIYHIGDIFQAFMVSIPEEELDYVQELGGEI